MCIYCSREGERKTGKDERGGGGGMERKRRRESEREARGSMRKGEGEREEGREGEREEGRKGGRERVTNDSH